MDFIAIDFETANSQRNSPCEIGLTFVRNFEVVGSKSWLIKPVYYEDIVDNGFDDYNIMIHGITPDDVKDKPEFNELWTEIKPLIENQFLIAHNASFDFSVLRKTLETYEIPFPNLDYACSCIFSKSVWENMSNYGLATLCDFNAIKFDHHRAEADSRATAELAIKAFKTAGVVSKEDFPSKLKTKIGSLFSDGYEPCVKVKEYAPKKNREITGDASKHNPDSIFYGKTVVFTGTLLSMPREQAQQTIADIGGINASGLTMSTDYLVVGQQDYKKVGEDGMSSKQEKAIRYITEKGCKIEILSEDEFVRSI